MTEIIPYEPRHFMLIREAAQYFSELHIHYGFTPEQLARYYLRGPAYTMVNDEGIIIVCAGIIKLWDRVGDAWVLASPMVTRYPVAVTKATKTYMHEIARNLKLERIQAIVKKDFETGHRWIKALGFHEEGPLEKYFGGIDFVRYALITNLEEL